MTIPSQSRVTTTFLNGLAGPVAAQRYIRRIRNLRKRHYANVYLDHLLGILPEEPDWGDLSYMAAQAVRMDLSAILRPRVEVRDTASLDETIEIVRKLPEVKQCSS